MKLLYFYAGRYHSTRESWLKRAEDPELYDGAYVYCAERSVWPFVIPLTGEWYTADRISAWKDKITPEMKLQALLLT